MAHMLPVKAPDVLPAALELLLEGNQCARDVAQSEWEFAVEIVDLQAAGLTKNAIRWLVHKGYVKFALETTKALGKPGRQFCSAVNLIFPSRSCLVLTAAGVHCAQQLVQPGATILSDAENISPTATTSPPASPASPPVAPPQWDPDLRTLRVGDVLVKHFKVPAGNQELILSAFQEDDWPAFIDDPLPPAAGIDAKRRLHDAINRLNRNQSARLIYFKGNGNGRAIRWEYAEVIATDVPPHRL
jgi:hypothetical protein